MCVAVAIPKGGTLPTLDQIKLMDEANPHGAGIAWLYNGRVMWLKNLDKPEIIYNILKTLPMPLLLHFRLASVGGIHGSLTHPFPITREAELDDSGSAKEVLIHNGHWSAYEAVIQAFAKKELPKGRMTDTRMMAFLAAHRGSKVLKWLGKQGQKIATLDRQGIIYLYGKWEDEAGFHCSNNYWKARSQTTIGGQNFDWKAYLDEKYPPTSSTACEPYYMAPSYAEFEDTYVPQRLHRMTEKELIQEMIDQGGEG